MEFDQALSQLKSLQQCMVEIARQGDWEQLRVAEAETQHWMKLLTDWQGLDMFQMERLRRQLLELTKAYKQVLTESVGVLMVANGC